LYNIALLAKHEASLKALRSGGDDTDGRSPSGKPPRKGAGSIRLRRNNG
jgi:hypothetical protein